MAPGEKPFLVSRALNAAIIVLCAMSAFLLYRLWRLPENSYTPVNARSSAFSPADDHGDRETKPEAARGVSSLDMVQRIVVPFAEPEAEEAPAPDPPPAPPAETPAAEPEPEAAPQPAPPFGKPSLRKVAIPSRNSGSSASSSAFLPAAPDEKKKPPSASAGAPPAANSPSKPRGWRTPTGHSSSHP